MVEKEPSQSRDSSGWAQRWDLFSERESLPPGVCFSIVDRERDCASSLCLISSCGEWAGGSMWMYTGSFWCVLGALSTISLTNVESKYYGFSVSPQVCVYWNPGH